MPKHNLVKITIEGNDTTCKPIIEDYIIGVLTAYGYNVVDRLGVSYNTISERIVRRNITVYTELIDGVPILPNKDKGK